MVSVIIPIYNCERTLGRCMKTMLSQTYSDFELILVDDGSTDGSLDIIKKYAAQDSRIRYTTKTNSGASSARNSGIEMAKGDFVSFIDADDYVSTNYLSELVKNMSSEVDVVICEFEQNNYPGGNGEATMLSSKDEIVKAIITKQYGQAAMGPCAKLYRRSLLKELRFCESLYLGEDTLFSIEYAKLCRQGMYLAKILYYYETPTSSASYKMDPKKLDRYLTVVDSREKMLTDMSMLSRESQILLINELYYQILVAYYQSRYFHNWEKEIEMGHRMHRALNEHPLPFKQRFQPYSCYVLGHFPHLFPIWNAIATRIKRHRNR